MTLQLAFKDDEVRFDALRHRHDTERSAACALRAIANHLVDARSARVDGAGKAVAASAIADDLDAPFGDLVTEGSGGFEPDGVDAELDEGIAVLVGVGTGDVGTPVSPRIFVGAPDADFFVASSGWVDVEASGWSVLEVEYGRAVSLTARQFHTSSLGRERLFVPSLGSRLG